MDIAFIDVTTTVSYGGIQTAIWELARQLHDLGHKVTIYGGAGNIQPDLEGRGIRVRTFPFTPRNRVPNLGTRFRKFWERFSFAGQARDTVIAANHDWLVFTKPFDMVWPRLLHGKTKARFVYSGHGTDFFQLDRWLAKDIDAWVACSHFNAWQLYSRFKRSPRVIFNGVKTDIFCPERRQESFREKIGVGGDDILLAYAGRIVGWKGLKFAIDALTSTDLASLPLKLLIVGAGAELARLDQQVRDRGLGDKVIFHPPVPHRELPNIYASADIGVFPSIGDEGFPITVIEAMSCGIPVVATHIGGTPEAVGNEGNCGHLIEIGNESQLTDAIRDLATNPAKRVRMGQAARVRIVANFTWEMAARRLIAALDAVPPR